MSFFLQVFFAPTLAGALAGVLPAGCRRVSLIICPFSSGFNLELEPTMRHEALTTYVSTACFCKFRHRCRGYSFNIIAIRIHRGIERVEMYLTVNRTPCTTVWLSCSVLVEGNGEGGWRSSQKTIMNKVFMYIFTIDYFRHRGSPESKGETGPGPGLGSGLFE